MSLKVKLLQAMSLRVKLFQAMEEVKDQAVEVIKQAEATALAVKMGILPPPPQGLCPVNLIFDHPNHYCGRPLLSGSPFCYWHTRNADKYEAAVVEQYFGSGTTLVQAVEREVAERRSLEDAYLAKVELAGNWFKRGANLKGARLRRVQLANAHLSYSDLDDADLAYANLEGALLSDCRLSGTRLHGTRLFKAKFRNSNLSEINGLTRDNFRGLRWGWLPTHRMLEDHPDQAEPMYRALASYFASEGLFDDASWAAYRACGMKHRLLKKRLSPTHLLTQEVIVRVFYPKPIREGRISEFGKFRFCLLWVMAVLGWLRSLCLKGLMGYGEKPLRVLANAALAILGYATIYWTWGAVNDKTFVGSFYFSMITFTTVGYGDLAPHGIFRLVAASEAVVGILLSGLFIFCLARRSVGRS